MVYLARVLFQVHRQQLYGKLVFQECYQHQCAGIDMRLHVYLDIKEQGSV
jgi:hypothetical protein